MAIRSFAEVYSFHSSDTKINSVPELNTQVIKTYSMSPLLLMPRDVFFEENSKIGESRKIASYECQSAIINSSAMNQYIFNRAINGCLPSTPGFKKMAIEVDPDIITDMIESVKNVKETYLSCSHL